MPDSLIDVGFEKLEEQSADSSRWVHYSKLFTSGISDITVEVRLRYLLIISDDPNGSWTENTRYHFEGADISIGSYEEDDDLQSQYYKVKIDSIQDLENIVYYLTGIRQKQLSPRWSYSQLL